MWLSTLVVQQLINTKLYGNSLKVSVSNRTEVPLQLIDGNLSVPAGELNGFTLGNPDPAPGANDLKILLLTNRKWNCKRTGQRRCLACWC